MRFVVSNETKKVIKEIQDLLKELELVKKEGDSTYEQAEKSKNY